MTEAAAGLGLGLTFAAAGAPLLGLAAGVVAGDTVKRAYYEFVPDRRLDDYTPEKINERITTRVNETLRERISSAVDGRTLLHYQAGKETIRISPADIQHYLANGGQKSPYMPGMLDGLSGYIQNK
jgi:hypothetical protein